jgi:hypothetical protein
MRFSHILLTFSTNVNNLSTTPELSVFFLLTMVGENGLMCVVVDDFGSKDHLVKLGE